MKKSGQEGEDFRFYADRCDCCLKSIEELTPFHTNGDQSEEHSNTPLLVKKRRTLAPRNELVEKIYDEFFGDCETKEEFYNAAELMRQKYGDEKALEIQIDVQNIRSIIDCWECRQCALLNDEECHMVIERTMLSHDYEPPYVNGKAGSSKIVPFRRITIGRSQKSCYLYYLLLSQIT